MIVLHAGILEGQFFLWGEIPPEDQALLTKGRKRKGDSRTASSFLKHLPYSAEEEKLSTVLKEAGFGFRASKRSTGIMIVWLPTVDNKPIPSSPLIAEAPEDGTKAILVPWTVTGLRLSTEQVVELLCASVGKQTLASGIIIGKDLAFWTIALRFAGALVAKQRFLPGMAQDNGIYLARWRAVFSGLDAERLSRLAKAMPAVSRALTYAEGRHGQEHTMRPQTPPEVTSVSMLSGFVESIVDHLVRTSIGPEEIGFRAV